MDERLIIAKVQGQCFTLEARFERVRPEDGVADNVLLRVSPPIEASDTLWSVNSTVPDVEWELYVTTPRASLFVFSADQQETVAEVRRRVVRDLLQLVKVLDAVDLGTDWND